MTTTRVEVQSMLVISSPPDVTGEGDSEVEHFVRVGPRGARRRLTRGDHVDPQHELVRLFPSCFQASGEVADTVVLSVPSAEVQARVAAEAARLVPRPAEVVIAVCDNCGYRSDTEVMVHPQVQALAVAAALDAAETLDDRERVRFQSVHVQRLFLDGAAARAAAFQAFQLEHTVCDPSRELHPLPTPPEREPGQGLAVWSGPISLRG